MTFSAPAAALERLPAAQIQWTANWHLELPSAPPSVTDSLEDLVEREHRANFDLWHEEDKARDPEATDAAIAAVKRSIDRINQRRNDLVEAIDEWLLQHLPTPTPTALLHSETPGMMLDRLSILTLKLYHTQEQIDRPEVTLLHRERNMQRLATLQEQHADLAGALSALALDLLDGRQSFKLYRQLKMYNDPELNPQVYGKGRG